MSKVLVTESYLEDIASAIRGKNGQSASYTPSEMASAIDGIVPIGDSTLISATFSENGSYSPSDYDADAFSNVVVAVSNAFTAEDNGKVVMSGSLSRQWSSIYSSNGTYNTTNINEAVISVPNAYSAVDAGKVVYLGRLVTQGASTFTVNSVYNTTLLSSVTVDVQAAISHADEGKVVHLGSLINQGSSVISYNGTYDTTYLSEITASIASGADIKKNLFYNVATDQLGSYSGESLENPNLVVSGSEYVGKKAVIVIMHRDDISLPDNFTLVSKTRLPNYNQWISIYEKILTADDYNVTITTNGSIVMAARVFYFDPQVTISPTPEMREFDSGASTYKYTIERTENYRLAVLNHVYAGSMHNTSVKPAQKGGAGGQGARLIPFVVDDVTDVVCSASTTITPDAALTNRLFLYDINISGNFALATKTIETNGTYNPHNDNVDAFSNVIVSVPNTYTAEDEGKVVVSGELVSQNIISMTFSENSIYTPEDFSASAFSQIVVNVQGGSGGGGGEGTLYADIINGTASEVIDTQNAVTSVRSYAFYNFKSLQTISFPFAVEIGSSAFYGCSSLNSISLPRVQTVHSNAFALCNSLTSVALPSATIISYSAFLNCPYITDVSLPNVISIYSGAFQSCSRITSLYMPNVQFISYGFYACYGLTEVQLSQATTLYSAFYNCSNISYVSCPEAVDITGAFFGCSSLTSVYVPKAVNVNNAFNGCRNLVSVDLPQASVLTGTFAGCYILESVSIPNVTVISYSAFANCRSLVNADYPSVTSLGQGAYYSCTGLVSVSFPEVTYIGQTAFWNCNNLSFAYIPKASVIGSSAFQNCKVDTLSLPMLSLIYPNAFQGCTLISLFLMGSSVCSLSNTNAFTTTPMSGTSASGTIYVPLSLYNNYLSAKNWSVFSSRLSVFVE